MDRGAWQATVHGVAKSWTGLNDFTFFLSYWWLSGKDLPAKQEIWVHFLGQEDPLQKEMATHSSILARKIPWSEESDGLQSQGVTKVLGKI